MKAHFWAFADSAGLGLQDLSRGAHKEPVPFFSVTKCLRQWMLHPVLSKVIVEVSNAKTLPFLSGTPRPVPSVITCMADGTEWLSPLLRTRSLWQDTFNYCQVTSSPSEQFIIYFIYFFIYFFLIYFFSSYSSCPPPPPSALSPFPSFLCPYPSIW